MTTLASPVLADGWYFEASLEGGAEFWTYTNETDDVSPRRQRGNEIWITHSDEVNGLDENGTCNFNYCTVTVTLAERGPAAGERVSILFSNGERLDFAASGSHALMSNYSTAGMGRPTCSSTTCVGQHGARSGLATCRIASIWQDRRQLWTQSSQSGEETAAGVRRWRDPQTSQDASFIRCATSSTFQCRSGKCPLAFFHCLPLLSG